MATSSRTNSGAYDTLWTNTVERWLNENRAEDTVFLQTPTLALLTANSTPKPLTHTLAVRLGNSRGTGVDSFEYYDTVSTQPTQGTQAANFQVANYSAPCALSEQEKLELDTPQKIHDHCDWVMTKQREEMGQRLAEDIFKGNASNAKNLVGLEQMLPDYQHLDNTGSTPAITEPITTRWQMKQAANTYGGIQRVAWTSSAEGTYWEGNACDFLANGANKFAYSSGAPNDPIQRLYNVIAMSGYGMQKPNIAISTYQPWEDYQTAAASTQQITRGAGMITANISFDNCVVKGLTWFWDDFAETYQQFSAAIVGTDNIYLLDTNKCKLEIDSRWNFKLTDMRHPVDQHARVQHILWRGQLVNYNPRSSARIFNYNEPA